MSTDHDNWTPEECRYFLQLYMEEKKKGNTMKNGLNGIAKDYIIDKFEERFGQRLIWKKFKNKYDTCRRQYLAMKKLTHNRTGLGYDHLGRIDMSEDWWKQRIEEWPQARNFKKKLVPNADLFEEEFGSVTVSGDEGWSAQQGEASLDSRIGENYEDEYDAVDLDMSPRVEETQTKAGSSRPKKKRKVVDLATETCAARNAILAQKNKLMEQMFEREHKYSVEHVVEILNELPGVRKWSPFHSASVDHLIVDEANRQGFMAFSSVEDRISYLEHRTGKKLSD